MPDVERAACGSRGSTPTTKSDAAAKPADGRLSKMSRSRLDALLILRRSQRRARLVADRAMRPRTFALIAVVIIAAIAIVRAAKGADIHPAMTADHGPGWRVQECRPAEPCRWRGRIFDNSTGCQVDLWSVANTAPKGTRVTCPKVDANHKVTDR